MCCLEEVCTSSALFLLGLHCKNIESRCAAQTPLATIWPIKGPQAFGAYAIACADRAMRRKGSDVAYLNSIQPPACRAPAHTRFSCLLCCGLHAGLIPVDIDVPACRPVSGMSGP